MVEPKKHHTETSIKVLLRQADSCDKLHQIGRLFDDEDVIVTCTQCGFDSIAPLFRDRAVQNGLDPQHTRVYLEKLRRHTMDPTFQTM